MNAVFKRDSVDVVQTALQSTKDEFTQKMLEVYSDQSKGILVMHYNAIIKKYSLNEKGSIINTETKQLLTQAKTEWINEDEGDEGEKAEKPSKAKKVKAEKEPKPEKIAKVKVEKPEKVKKEKIVKEPRILKFADYEIKFKKEDRVAFYISDTENTGTVTGIVIRPIAGVISEVVLIKNDNAEIAAKKKGGLNAVNAKKVRFIDGMYEESVNVERKAKKLKSEKTDRKSKYEGIPLKFVKGDSVAFLLNKNGEQTELQGIVMDSFHRTQKKGAENVIFNQIGISVNEIPYYKSSVYVRAFPDGTYEPIPEKNSGRKPKVAAEEVVEPKVSEDESPLAEEVLASEELVEA